MPPTLKVDSNTLAAIAGALIARRWCLACPAPEVVKEAVNTARAIAREVERQQES